MSDSAIVLVPAPFDRRSPLRVRLTYHTLELRRADASVLVLAKYARMSSQAADNSLAQTGNNESHGSALCVFQAGRDLLVSGIPAE